MITYIHANPGQKITLLQELLDSNQQRVDSLSLDGYSDGYDDGYFDGYFSPVVKELILPSGVASTSFPLTMVRVSEGLYKLDITLPNGPTAIGTFITNIEFYDPVSLQKKTNTLAINVVYPFGNTSIIPA